MKKEHDYKFDGFDAVMDGNEILWDDISERAAYIIIELLNQVDLLENTIGKIEGNDFHSTEEMKACH